MTRKRKLAVGREDSQPSQDVFLFRRQHENGFRQIHLAGNLLHLLVSQSLAFGKHSQRITRESAIGKHIELNEIVSRQNVFSFSLSLWERGEKQKQRSSKLAYPSRDFVHHFFVHLL